MRSIHPPIYGTLRLLWPGGLETRRHLRELERTQWLSKAELGAFQLAKIQELVSQAYEHVPFYRERYQQAGIRPEDIRSLEDFQALPSLSREDVKNNLDRLVADNAPLHRLHKTETGGSTGQPIQFYLEASFWWWNAANVFRMRRWHGVHEGEKTAWFWGARQDMPDWSWRNRVKAYLMQERYLNAFAMTEGKMHDFADVLLRWRPAMFKGYPSAVCLFAKYLKERDITGIRPRFIETTSEKLMESQRELLEEVFGCTVADQYSSRELGTMACPCERGGFHICSDLRYLEIIADDQRAEPGQMGEVVVTSLTQFAMPFIRYKNGDLAIYREGPCSCGRSFPLLKEIVGRTNDSLISADGQFVHSEFFAYLFRVKPEVVRYQVYQPDKEHLEVRLVCNRDVSDVWLNAVRGEIQDRFGQLMKVSLQVVDHIELSPAGKHRYIISEVRPDLV